MKSILAVLLAITLISFNSCAQESSNSEKEAILLIETNFGDMKVKLYNETPQHRDNFLKLAKEDFYDDLLFHRVIDAFMIQGGDPESKDANAGTRLGNGGPGYTIEAEINSNFIHKKGALSAARQGDNVNPEKRSSGSQFYIVQGQVTQADILKRMLKQKNQVAQQKLINDFLGKPENKAYLDQVIAVQQAGDQAGMNELLNEIKMKVDVSNTTSYSYTPEQMNTYASIGGTPHLDGDYTVFGEVIEGIEIIDKIASVKTGVADRPLEDITMKIKILEDIN